MWSATLNYIPRWPLWSARPDHFTNSDAIMSRVSLEIWDTSERAKQIWKVHMIYEQKKKYVILKPTYTKVHGRAAYEKKQQTDTTGWFKTNVIDVNSSARCLTQCECLRYLRCLDSRYLPNAKCFKKTSPDQQANRSEGIFVKHTN